MKIKLLLPLLFLTSCISAQAQISVTVASGIGQTFINEDASFGQRGNRKSSLHFFSEPSYIHRISVSIPLTQKYKMEIGIEALKESLITYRLGGTAHSTALATSISSGDYSSLISGSVSLPLNIIHQKPLWKDKIFSSLKLGATYSFNAHFNPPTTHQGSSSYYGVSDDDTTSFNFIVVRFKHLRSNTVHFNMGASLDWKISKSWQVSIGGHYRHGFMAFAKGEATYFENVGVNATPDQLNDARFMGLVASTLYNSYMPTDRHSFTTNGTSFFGTLALTYTFAKKDKEK